MKYKIEYCSTTQPTCCEHDESISPTVNKSYLTSKWNSKVKFVSRADACLVQYSQTHSEGKQTKILLAISQSGVKVDLNSQLSSNRQKTSCRDTMVVPKVIRRDSLVLESGSIDELLLLTWSPEAGGEGQGESEESWVAHWYTFLHLWVELWLPPFSSYFFEGWRIPCICTK